jgi:uncharacterized membrane protein YphA (DoxX/SURF4 family)
MEKAKGLAALRVFLGAGFLYAGLEKVFDFAGSGKPFTSAGFLQFGTAGTLPGSDPKAIVNPTHDLWVSLATNAQLIGFIDGLVLVGELAIGAALILGLATRFAGVMGAILMGFITVAAWSFAFGPVNETMLYAAVAPTSHMPRPASPTGSTRSSRRARSSSTDRHCTTCSDSDPAAFRPGRDPGNTEPADPIGSAGSLFPFLGDRVRTLQSRAYSS